jgi:hypothetical protein
VYAATATFYECLAGHPPFTGKTTEVLLRQHQSAPVPLEPVPAALRPLVAAGMAKDPAERPADATTFVTRLRAAASESCGPDWEDRGRSHLGEAALLLAALWPSALLAALWPSGAQPAVQGPAVQSPVAQSPVVQSPVAQSPVAQSPAAPGPVAEPVAPPRRDPKPRSRGNVGHRLSELRNIGMAKAAIAAGAVIVVAGGTALAATLATAPSHPAAAGQPTSSPSSSPPPSASSSSSLAGTSPTTSAPATTPPAGPSAGPPVDVATGKSITADGQEGPDFTASYANDGNLSTYWEGLDNSGYPQTLTVNLGSATSIATVVLELPPLAVWTPRTQTVSVLGSDDDSTWNTLTPSASYNFSYSTGNTVTIQLPAGTSARYVQLSFTANTGWSAAQIAEFQVFTP